MMRPSDAKVSAALREAELPELAARAEAGEFNEFFGPHVCSITYLVGELSKLHTRKARELRKRLIDGEFDAGREESEEWVRSAEGQDAMRRLMRGE